MIQEYRQAHPNASVRKMCHMLGVSRSWLYEKPAVVEPSEADTCLRDAIERLCLAFPGYGYRRVNAQLQNKSFTETAGRSITSGC